MTATIMLCERNGAVPGNPTENTAGINWRGTDNSNQTYATIADSLYTNTWSYEKYNYIHFFGNFTSIANVSLTNATTLDNNLILKISNTATSSSDCVNYAKPQNTISSVAINQFSYAGNSINLLVGNTASSDSAGPSGKTSSSLNGTIGVYSNYFVTQLYVGPNAAAGAIAPVLMTLTYDEN